MKIISCSGSEEEKAEARQLVDDINKYLHIISKRNNGKLPPVVNKQHKDR
jgi:hypothetical protein